ncbi:hypothetical protein POM88_038940 [Heracleum sosnowskyi]|uniref:Uncharacterized protein n=1 Tax=Heracleum sosnowskyi TaxID=360622 RepID=A0AAD8M8B3_9APIA|nr:hypothetical protein POM88_038940 [Heracleum sosnowskyi]
MDNITDEEQEAPQSSDIDRELLELNEVIDLIKSNSIEHISELLQPINSNNTNNTCHPSHRRFLRDEFIRIREMTMSGIAPRQILTSLRQSNANLQSISRSIYNAMAKI